MTELVCIVCPKGCRLHVDEENDYKVTGHTCPRGVKYGQNELKNPTRVLTSTVKIKGGLYHRCPVKTDNVVPKGSLMDIMKALNSVELQSPIRVGDIVIPNVAGTDANIVATKNL